MSDKKSWGWHLACLIAIPRLGHNSKSMDSFMNKNILFLIAFFF